MIYSKVEILENLISWFCKKNYSVLKDMFHHVCVFFFGDKSEISALPLFLFYSYVSAISNLIVLIKNSYTFRECLLQHVIQQNRVDIQDIYITILSRNVISVKNKTYYKFFRSQIFFFTQYKEVENRLFLLR